MNTTWTRSGVVSALTVILLMLSLVLGVSAQTQQEPLPADAVENAHQGLFEAPVDKAAEAGRATADRKSVV